MRYNLLNLIVIIFLLFITEACSENTIYDFENTYKDKQTITLSVSLQNQNIATRTDQKFHISSGSQIDVLKYAVYEKLADGSFVIAPEFKKRDVTFNSISTGVGQNLNKINVSEWLKAPLSIQLITNPEKTYRVVFWAQCSKFDRYDTSDLEEIKIDYSKSVKSKTFISNNNESCDAFYGFVDFAGDSQKTVEVVLHRPFTQINIGTTGADYKTLIYDEKLNPANVILTESKIKIKGVANRFNAIKGTATAVDENNDPNENLVAEFDWATIPAWINTGVPAFDAGYLKLKPEENPFVQLSDKEEFLKVKLNKDDDIGWKYLTEYPTVSYKKKTVDGEEVDDLNQIDKYLAQTFKYLSMCYVLVPSKQDENGNSTSATVDLTYNLRQNIDGLRDIQLTEKTIKNVPVQANFRTNILFGLYKEDPDPTSIFTSYRLPMILQEEFFERIDVPEPDNNWKYYTTTFNITRTYPDEDKLLITNLGTGISLNTLDKEGIEVSYLSESVVFSAAVDNPAQLNFNQYKFKVKEGYQISILCDGVYPQKPGTNGDEELSADYYNWWTIANNDNTEVALYLFPGATSANFKITIDLKDNSQNKPENPDDNP